MLKIQVIVILTLYLSTIFIKNLVISEWIELPQFSDKMKVYRKSSVKFDVMKVNNVLNNSKNNFFNVTTYTNCDSDGNYGDILLKPPETLIPTDSDQISDPGDRNKNGENSPRKIQNLNKEKTFSNRNTTDNIENESALSTQIYTTTKSSFFEFSEDNFKLNKKKQSSPYNLWNYIPINQLKRVHQILIENLGRTHKEKLDFLESFKNDLTRTIRTMIPDIINRKAESPVRKKRGSSWDEHEHHMGFPSLEGALLAISFLTFAIYLIRLIMMLMRNLSSNTTTTGNTIFINRNKRFITQLTEETVRIHDYLHEFNSRL